MFLHNRHWVTLLISTQVSFLTRNPAPYPSNIGFPSQKTHRVLFVKPCEPTVGIDLGSGLSPDGSCAVGAGIARALGIGALGAMGATATHQRVEERAHGGEAGAEDRDAGFDDCPDEDVDAVPGRVDGIVILESGDADDGDAAHAGAR